MLGQYPIVLENEVRGTLNVTREGLMTVFSAECEDIGRVVRLSVYGEDGVEGYIGVMVPCGEKISLRRAMSRSALDIFPQEIAYVSEAGQSMAPESEPESKPDSAAPDTLWFPVPEGTLVSLGGNSLLAMPWRDGAAIGEERVIEGKRYAVVSAGEIAIPAGEW